MSITPLILSLGEGLLRSIAIFFWTLIFSLPLGLIICKARMSKYKILSWTSSIYISLMRGTPLILQLLVVYFGPYFLFEIPLSQHYRFYAVLIAFSLNYAGYFAEIYRSGYMGIPKGQYEAAQVLGYSNWKREWYILIPQMLRRTLPSITNEAITLVKDTSIAFAIAYTEMFTLAKQMAASTSSMMPFVIAAVFYYLFNLLVASVMQKIESHYTRYGL